MKKILLLLVMLLWPGAAAQETSFREFRSFFAYVFRVAETPCPEQLGSVFPEGICYRHGYTDFFNFKEAVTSLMVGPERYLEPWHVVTMTVAGETLEALQARYRLAKNIELTLTWIDKDSLVLEPPNLSLNP